MTNDDKIQRPLNRRHLLRGGAVLAGAAGATVVGAAMGPSAAQAADGQFMVVGQPNASESSTKMTVGGVPGNANPALSLVNANGPALHLAPAGDSYDSDDLKVGEIANTGASLDVGVPTFDGAQTTWLATGLDLDQIPITFPIPPERLIDTRIKTGRANITMASANAFDSKFRLKAGAWLDVGIIPTDFVGLDAVFVNVTAVKPVKNGVLTAYPPGGRPLTSTVNFPKGQTVANGAFIGVGVAREVNPDWPASADWFVIRIYTTTVTHLVIDLTGVTLRGIAGATSSKVGQAKQRKAAKANRMKRIFR